jgi:hypothetical protein
MSDTSNDEDMAIIHGKGGALEALRGLQDEGLVGSIGVATGVRGIRKPVYGYWEAQPEIVEAVGKMQDRGDELGVTLAEPGRIDEYFLGGPEFVWPFPEDRMPESVRAKL